MAQPSDKVIEISVKSMFDFGPKAARLLRYADDSWLIAIDRPLNEWVPWLFWPPFTKAKKGDPTGKPAKINWGTGIAVRNWDYYIR